jgi:hypothetical protein
MLITLLAPLLLRSRFVAGSDRSVWAAAPAEPAVAAPIAPQRSGSDRPGREVQAADSTGDGGFGMMIWREHVEPGRIGISRHSAARRKSK